jgi:hypothetical protein
MKKTIDLTLQLNKKTIARLDPKAMKKIKGGAAAAASGSDKNSNGGTNCSCVCCAGFPA